MTRPRPTYADIRRSHAGSKAREEWQGEWAAALLYRPVALILTPLFLRLSFSATGITALALALALCLPAIALWGGAQSYIALGLCGAVIAILDCIDGTVARVTATVSLRGHYLDFVTDIAGRAAFYAALGIAADIRADDSAPLEGYGLSAGLGAALLAVAARLCRVYTERRTKGPAVSAPPGTLFSFVSGLDHLLPLATLAAGYWNGLGWLLVWLLFYSALDFAYTQYAALKRPA